MTSTRKHRPDGCDTFVGLGSATASGQTIFAKNSDRPPEEAQPLELHERATYPPGTTLKTHFVEMPQAPVTHRHVGSRPYWCWGYEHGFNEHQVVIGNEALQSGLRPSGPTLTGMDLVRLGLERGATAAEAVEVITGIVSEYGQGNFAHPDGHLTYDNGFIIADPSEAYVLETAGHEWAVRRVKTQTGISNVLSITTDWDAVSPGAEQAARKLGWDGVGRLSFADAFTESDRFSGSGFMRRSRSCAVLDRHDGKLSATGMMSLLSDHADGDSDKTGFVTGIDPGHGICMHSDRDGVSNTAASLVAELCDDGSRLPIYWTSMYSPCLGIFLPMFVQGDLPGALSYGAAEESDYSVWWLFRRLADAVLGAPERRVADVRSEWAPLQAALFKATYATAREGRRLLDARRPDDAHRLLTEQMAENLSSAVLVAATLLESYAGDRVPLAHRDLPQLTRRHR
jgi:secernin